MTRFQLNVSDIGIHNMWVQYAQPREDGNGLAFIAGANNTDILLTMDDVESLIGKSNKGWFSRDQRFRYGRYTADNGNGDVTFVYFDGEMNGLNNPLIWVIVEGGGAGERKTVDGYEQDNASPSYPANNAEPQPTVSSILDVLTLDYPSSVAMDIKGTASILTSLDAMIDFVVTVNENQGWGIYYQPTRETVANDIKYLCEMVIEHLMWLNDDKDGNISHPELEADERLAEFLGNGRIIAVPHFEVLLFDVMEGRITVIANIDLHNRDGYSGIAVDFRLDSGYSIQGVYMAS